jgi:hypothetical protein
MFEELKDIFDRTPSILSAVSSEPLEHLRIAASMMLLTGQSRAERWLTSGLRRTTFLLLFPILLVSPGNALRNGVS